jgi:hypothetical protein
MLQTAMAGGQVDLVAAEKELRDAALADAGKLFASLLSSIEPPIPVCPSCNKEMASSGRRDKEVVSLMGTGTVSRRYYSCPECNTHAVPLDVLAQMEHTSYTPGVQKAVSKLASTAPFEWTSETLLEISGVYVSPKEVQRISEAVGAAAEEKRGELRVAAVSGTAARDGSARIPAFQSTFYIEYDGTGVPMARFEVDGRKGKAEDGTAKTREAKLGCIFTQTGFDEQGVPIRDDGSTSYFGAIEPAGEFAQRVYAEAVLRDLRAYRRTVILGDGAKWIWNIADTAFPGAIQIVDAFHAREHVCELAKALPCGAGGAEGAAAELLALLDAGDIDGLIDAVRVMAAGLGEEAAAVITRELGYFKDNAHRMRYADFRRAGLFVGSGVIEAGCKSVIAQRLKQSGMFWSVAGANAIIALRCRELSGKGTAPVFTLGVAA